MYKTGLTYPITLKSELKLGDIRDFSIKYLQLEATYHSTVFSDNYLYQAVMNAHQINT